MANFHFHTESLKQLIQEEPSVWFVVEDPISHQRGVISGEVNFNEIIQQWSLIGVIPLFHPAYLGDVCFLKAHRAQYPYIVGEMANGIATAKMVIAAASAGLVSFFGAAGLIPSIVEDNIVTIRDALKDISCSWGSNLIHSPNEPMIEEAVVNVYLTQKVRRVSASAYMELSPHIVHYSFKGISLLPDGQIKRPNHVIAKISREEVAKQFMMPPSAEILSHLVQQQKLTQSEAQLASQLPVAEDITVEADSGGHTDNRPSTVLFPLINKLVNQMNQHYSYKNPIRVGLAGGIGTPEAVYAAFSMGAAYVLTGTINETAVESGLSEEGKKMMSSASMTDVIMAAAADMFEQGVKLQVLKRGTLFGSKANKLYSIYKTYNSLEEIPRNLAYEIEQQIFRLNFAEVWQQTKEYFNHRDPSQIKKAEEDKKYKMGLVFRWYLGQSSRWAIQGEPTRKNDYQIWCGPCIGSFNQWIKGSYLEDLSQRRVVDIAYHLMYGAAQLSRVQQLRQMGVETGLWEVGPILRNFGSDVKI
ncbi:PfaD family polyunsaturated fatty acid/polyketide biosynthesis protein [Legionella brunensis]|uniref:Polyketide biosynthesis protein PksE n=1 Tax=Legionella brunensis TaxID=29422 RepID=A0A0W0SKX2_9GAMM|nr:PfaD family polyunsaturated fatty acid/polyketide biosynthesis protein [Legionella brunensis]KTC84032.1 Polyketide biosynthesis protein PksE [Legionella brunensis]